MTTPQPAFVRSPSAALGTSPDVGRFHRYRGFLLLTLLVLVLWLNLTFLVPLVMGAIFATVLNRMMDWLQKFAWLRKRVTLRASIVTATFVLGFLIPVSLLVALGANAAVEKLRALEDENFSIGQLTTNPGGAIDALGLRPFIDQIAHYSPVSQEQLRMYAKRMVVGMGTLTGNALRNFLASLPGVMFTNIVLLFTIFFLLVDGKRAVSFVRENSIFGRKQTDRIISVAENLCHSVMVATLVSGAVQATLVGISCLITGTDGIPLIVFVSFLCSFFPMVGTAPVTVGLTVLSAIQGDMTSAAIFGVFIPLVGVSDNFVRPYVLKGSAELHPLIGFVAAFGALDMIGFYGLFIGPVVVGLFFTLLPMVARSYPRSPRAS
jgi:predicted PurR-regulated permease PerM